MPAVLLRFFDDRFEDDVSVAHGGVISLQIERSGDRVVSLQGSVRATDNRLVVDDLLPVEDHRHVAINKSDVVLLPLTARLAGFLAGAIRPKIAPTPWMPCIRLSRSTT